MRTKYLSIGDQATPASFTKGAYFVGKMAWPKGLGELFALMDYVKQRCVFGFYPAVMNLCGLCNLPYFVLLRYT